MKRPRSGQRRWHNLPLQRTALIGRERDVAYVRQLIQGDEGRLVTLTGAGGCGKTRLALAIAAELAETFQDGAWLIELAPLTDPTLVPQAVASVLGVMGQGGRSIVDSVSAFLSSRQILVVLDNCEHVIQACADLADAILQVCAGVRLLTTSREPLHIAGEVTWRVPSLAVPDLRLKLSPADLLRTPSVRLFVERARAVQPNFALTAENARSIAAICAQVDGLPLAIELAAAWERALGVEEILLRLADSFQLLVGGSRTAPTRQQTLWATLEWSHTLLSEREQMTFRRLAVFAEGWDLAAAEAVCGGVDVAQGEVLSLLSRLVDTSLVSEEERDGHARYRLLVPVRGFAADYLARSGEAHTVQAAHARYFAEHAVQLASHPLQDPAQMVASYWRLGQIERDYQNFRTALQWLSDTAPIESALRLANVLAELWHNRLNLNEGRALLTELLHREGGEAGTRARALGWAGNFALLQGEPLAARALHTAILPLDEEIGDEVHLACTYNALGRDALALGDYAEAERLLEEALHRFQKLGAGRVQVGGLLAAREEIWTLYSLGSTAHEQDNLPRARAFYTRCLERATLIRGWTWVEELARYGLGRVAHQQGDHIRARQLLEEALAAQRVIDFPAPMALTLLALGHLLLDWPDIDGARTAFAESLTVSEDLGYHLGLTQALDAFAALAVADNDPERTWRLVGAAEQLRAASHTPLSPAARAERARRLAPARRMIDAETVDALTASGGALSLSDAIALARTLSESPATPARRAPGARSAEQDVLTPRELEVAVLVARGLSNRQIGEQLQITRRTAAAHVEHILSKLGFASRIQVGIWAAEHGLAGLSALAT